MKKLTFTLMILGVITLSACANNDNKRIKPSKVNMRNYEVFVSQIRKDLPVGTPIQKVKEYLSARQIGYSDVIDEEDCFKFMLRRISSFFFIFNTDLQVRIYFTNNLEVSEVKSRLIETAL